MFFFESYIFFLPEIYFLFFLICFFIFCLFLKYIASSVHFSNILILLFFPCLSLLLFLLVNQFYLDLVFFFDFFILNPLVNFLKIFVIVLIIIIIFFSFNYFKFERFFFFEFFFLLFFSILGIFFFLSSNNFFFLYLTLELQSFCFYILCSLKKYSSLSVEAALKYFILGSFASSSLLFGISLIYGCFGSLTFFDIELLLLSLDFFNNYFLFFCFGFFFIIIGFFFKLSIIPFHFWIADVYEGSPFIVMVFFSIIPKISFIFLFFYLFIFLFYNLFFYFINFFYFSAFFSIFLGILLTLYQFKIKRLLAFGAIVHMGYMILSLISGLILGFISLFFYLIIYVLLSLGFFIILLSFRHQRSFFYITKVVDFSFLFKGNFILAFFSSLFLLSFAGVPPLSGFFGKFFILLSLIELDSYFFSALIVILTIISVTYYIRLFALFFLMIFFHFFLLLI